MIDAAAETMSELRNIRQEKVRGRRSSSCRFDRRFGKKRKEKKVGNATQVGGCVLMPCMAVRGRMTGVVSFSERRQSARSVFFFPVILLLLKNTRYVFFSPGYLALPRCVMPGTGMY